jgi:hypothetical protein
LTNPDAAQSIQTKEANRIMRSDITPGAIFKHYEWGRPSIADLHADLRVITSRIRPDWKIDTPEMKAAWERKEKEQFFPLWPVDD